MRRSGPWGIWKTAEISSVLLRRRCRGRLPLVDRISMVSSRIQHYFPGILTLASLSKLGVPDDTIGGCPDFFRRILPTGHRDLVLSLCPVCSPMSSSPPYSLAFTLFRNTPPLACFLHSHTPFRIRCPTVRRHPHLGIFNVLLSPISSFFYMCVSHGLPMAIHRLVLVMPRL